MKYFYFEEGIKIPFNKNHPETLAQRRIECLENNKNKDEWDRRLLPCCLSHEALTVSML